MKAVQKYLSQFGAVYDAIQSNSFASVYKI